MGSDLFVQCLPRNIGSVYVLFIKPDDLSCQFIDVALVLIIVNNKAELSLRGKNLKTLHYFFEF